MSRVAIYARVSTSDKQDFQRQIEELTEKIIRDGYSENQIDVFSEAISGYKSSKERLKLNELNQRIKKDENYYDRIYVSELSRIGRKPQDIRVTIDYWIDVGVDLYIHNIGQNTLDSDGKRNNTVNMVIQVLIEYADSEGRLFKQRSISGLLSSARAGKAGGGKNTPYGYRKDKDKMLVIDDEEADVIERIFKLYQKGYGSKVISRILNNDEISTRTKKAHKGKILNFKKIQKKAEDIEWSDTQVRSILINTIYIGKRRFKNYILKAPSIISEELFDECTEIRLSKTHRNHSTNYTYLLKDKLICGCCGRNYFAKYKPKIGGDKVYICSSRLKFKGNCGNVGVNISLLESAIYNEIISSKSILKHINNKDEVKKRLELEQEQIQNRIAINENLYHDCRRQQISLLNYALKIDLDAEMLDSQNKKLISEEMRLKDKLNSDRTQLRKITSGLKKQNDLGTTAEMLKNAKANRSELRAIFLELIDKIIINGIDEDNILANTFLSINEVVLPTTLKLYLNSKGIRKRKKSFQYIPVPGTFNALKYHDNILFTPIETIQEEIHTLKENSGLLDFDFVTISEENILQIPMK